MFNDPKYRNRIDLPLSTINAAADLSTIEEDDEIAETYSLGNGSSKEKIAILKEKIDKEGTKALFVMFDRQNDDHLLLLRKGKYLHLSYDEEAQLISMAAPQKLSNKIEEKEIFIDDVVVDSEIAIVALDQDESGEIKMRFAPEE